MKHSTLRLLGWLILAPWLLSGCAGTYLLDNNVHAFSGLTSVPAQPVYRFDRLPSQQSPAQAQLEAMADPALHKAGLRRDEASAHLTVQVSARLQRVYSPWASSWDGWGWGWGWHGRLGHGYGYPGPYGWMEPPWFQREVSVIMRELPSNRVVFESHAVNEGPWLDDTSVFPAMFEVALHGFPNPPAGPRRIDIQVGGKQIATN
ncbi:MAG TPA: DUF4136 domain-containing protein [Ramlibacter sp.]|nr:DUF4136 domain-containing protein [Ramlibacter sp.]